jgi:hypothetical protein
LQDDYIPPVRIEKIPPKENWFEWSTANGPLLIIIGQRLTVNGPQQIVIFD